MSSFTAPHSLVQPGRERDVPTPAVQPSRAATPPARRETYEETNARETRFLTAITGACVLFILVLFLTAMALLGNYGPTGAL